ncbi:MAG: Re/Si-specific NAD(P)(+) transhydrogenase subunit alpha [Pirellulaceae bacterium]
MKVAVLKETFPGERRVALVPGSVPQLVKAGLEVVVEQGAGQAAGYPDTAYVAKGATIVEGREAALGADVLLQVRALGANQPQTSQEIGRLRPGQIVLAMCDPLGAAEEVRQAADTGAAVFALEMIPRITRAQSMDVLSSMATIAGYRAVLLAAYELPRMLPMITYAAGMLRPARVFIVGAGVAGLRAIATAKALGAAVQAHDIRPTSREEVQSVGAKFVELKIEGETQDKGGYAKALTEADYQRQRELIADVAAESDVVITTAAIPGRQSPLLVTAAAVERMPQGAVIIDLGAERGGNCELTQADQRVEAHGVTILGPTNLPAEIPGHASEMFSSNLTKLLTYIVKDGKIDLDADDEIIRDTLVAKGGEVTNARLRGILNLPPLEKPAPPASSEEKSSEDKLTGTASSFSDDTLNVGDLGGGDLGGGDQGEGEDKADNGGSVGDISLSEPTDDPDDDATDNDAKKEDAS